MAGRLKGTLMNFMKPYRIHLPKFVVLLCCLVLIFSGCASLFAGVSSTPTPTIIVPTSTPTASNSPVPTPTKTLTNSDIARNMVQGMTLDQKLGQMVIVEFYGSTVTSDDMQMIQNNQVSG